MKSLQQRLDSIMEQTIIVSINENLEKLIRDATCSKSACSHNIANACHGSEHLACPGGSSCSSMCKSDSQEIHTKSLPPNKIITDRGCHAIRGDVV